MGGGVGRGLRLHIIVLLTCLLWQQRAASYQGLWLYSQVNTLLVPSTFNAISNIRETEQRAEVSVPEE